MSASQDKLFVQHTSDPNSGGPTAAVLALQNPNIRVHVVDKDSQRIGRWNSKHLPVHEPGLDSVVRIARDGLKRTHFVDGSIEVPERSPNLFFSTDVERSVAQADIVFISVNTPTKSCGIGAGSATNMAAFESAVISTAKHMKPGAILVEKSTVPCGTSQTIQDIVS
jgi:UDPglucose 6-dehydrogenase